jgi:uncharacterized SAM-dependent methyltransferase
VHRYFPIPLAATRKAIAASHPHLRVTAICADYLGHFAMPPLDAGPALCFFPGSTIGNFERDEAQAFLSGWRQRLGDNAMMLIGVDLLRMSPCSRRPMMTRKASRPVSA